MTFEQLLNGIKGLESDRSPKQIECFETKIRNTWGSQGAIIFRASLMTSPDGDFYIPEQYDDFTIASLIVA